MVGQWTLTPRMLVRIQTPEPDPFRDRLMVGQQTLNLLIEVRILAPEPVTYSGFVQWQDNGL